MTQRGSVDLAEVAEIYARSTKHPTSAVAHHFGISQSAAAKRVARCRAAGLLPPTIRGRETLPGEPSMVPVGEHRPVRVDVARSTPDARSFYACNACMVVWPCRVADR